MILSGILIGFWSGSLFLIAHFPDLCLLVLFSFYIFVHVRRVAQEIVDCVCCIKTTQCTGVQLTSILRTYVLDMHTKFQTHTPKKKVSVHNTKLQVMQSRRTLTTSSTIMRQLHVLHVLPFTLYRRTLRCV